MNLARLGRRVRHGPTGATQQVPGTVRVLTYNIHHGMDASDRPSLPQIAEVIDACDPDVVALQELDRFWGRRSGGIDQPGWLAQRLGLELAFGANLRRPGDRGGPPREYGIALMSKQPLTDARHVLFPAVPGVERRGFLSAHTEAAGAGARFVVTHLSTRGSHLRREQARLVRDVLATQAPMPTVVAGDLNASAWQSDLRVLRSVGRDAWIAAGRGAGGTTAHARPPRRIDYVLVSREWEVLRATRLTPLLSDHFPVLVDLVARV